MITPEQARKLLEGTTPAPWVLHPSKYVSGKYVASAESRTLVHATEPWAGPADAALIAAAPDLAMTVIELSEELNRVRGHVEEIEYTFKNTHLYVVRITPRATWEHPEFVGPLPYEQADALGERVWRETGRNYEIGQLVTEDELPGLWLADGEAAFKEALENQ